jgi:hypothetical protein
MTNQADAVRAMSKSLGHLVRAASAFAAWAEAYVGEPPQAQRDDWLMKKRLTDEFGDLVGRCWLLKGRVEIGTEVGDVVDDTTSTIASALSRAAQQLMIAAAGIRGSDPGAGQLAELLAAEVRSVAERTAAFRGKFADWVPA